MDEVTLQFIEDYFQGNLSEADKVKFEDRQKNDPDFKESIALFQTSRAVIKANYRDQLIGDTQKLMEDFEKNNKRILPIRRFISLAAVLIIFVVAVWSYRQFVSSPSPSRLYATHFELPSPPNVRSQEVAEDQLWTQAVRSYETGDYTQSINSLNNLLKKEGYLLKDRANFYLGISHLLIDEPQKGIQALEKIQISSSYFQQSLWYIALGHLKNENREQAKRALENIANRNGHYKQALSKELLEQI